MASSSWMLFAERGDPLRHRARGGHCDRRPLCSGNLSPVIETQLAWPAPSAAGITIEPTSRRSLSASVCGGGCALAVPLTSWCRGDDVLQQTRRVASEGLLMRRLRHGLIALESPARWRCWSACGLMVRSAVQIIHTDLGFDPARLNASRIMLRARNYPDPAAYRRSTSASPAARLP